MPPAVHAISIDTVPIGNANNAGDIQSNGIFGRVTSDYRIATTEVTNAQYVAFLNAVAAADPIGLYNTQMNFTSRGGIVRNGSAGSYTYSVKPDAVNVLPNNGTYTYGDKPVVFVSFFDAIRFTNWVNNGATPTSTTESGAYTLASGNSVTRNAGALWFLPSENQWYKAAYYDPSTSTYFDYPTKSNSPPNNQLPSADSGNSANYFNGNFTVDPDGSYPFTPVGAYSLSKSAYGTADQAGNASEWTESFGSSNTTRITRGGAFDTDATQLNAASRTPSGLTTEIEDIGFRLATIAVPGDYNVNGVVDAADYVLWRKNLGQSVTLPNDSTPGSVTNADYDVWRAHFGQTPATATPGNGLQLGAVPEPAGLLFVVISFTLCAFTRRR
jgi:formylglycine-generating enzyme required for sulfatase activity